MVAGAVNNLGQLVTLPLHDVAKLFRVSLSPLSRAFHTPSFRTELKVDTSEIVSILGHELGHWKMSHTLQGFAITQTYLLASFSAFALATELGESLRLSFGYSTPATLITLYLFFAVVSLVCTRTIHIMPHMISLCRFADGWHGSNLKRHPYFV